VFRPGNDPFPLRFCRAGAVPKVPFRILAKRFEASGIAEEIFLPFVGYTIRAVRSDLHPAHEVFSFFRSLYSLLLIVASMMLCVSRLFH
jgi:hypothetical protein